MREVEGQTVLEIRIYSEVNCGLYAPFSVWRTRACYIERGVSSVTIGKMLFEVDGNDRGTGMVGQKAENVHWHSGLVSREDRYRMLGHKGATVWFTGLSGSGKSTIAVALECTLMERGILSYRLDGDNVRLGINKNLGFSAEDRSENIRRVGEISKLFVDTGVIALSSFISPYSADRNLVRRLHESAGMEFIEVYVDCSLEEAERRDPKGLYKKARAGEVRGFTGIDDPYEAPENPEVHLRSDHMSVEQELGLVLAELERRGVLQNMP